MIATTTRPTSQSKPERFLAGVDTGGVVDTVVDTDEGGSVMVLSGPTGLEVCVPEPDERSGAPQRGQDFLFHAPKLEPHEVQYMFCFTGL